MASNMFLYWISGSVPCWKAMLALEEKGFSGYPNKQLSISKKEQKGEEVLKLNPRGQIPTFKDGDVVINESSAICFYLENKSSHTGTKLLPDDSAARAKVLQRVFEADNLQIIRDIGTYCFTTPKEKRDEDLLQKRYDVLRKDLTLWNGYLSMTKAFVAGTDFTMADVFFFPYIVACVRFGLDLGKFPAIQSYYEKVKERPSVKASWPPHWKEGPADDNFLVSV